MTFIGTSGWMYNHWYKKFYPENLNRGEWLPHYSQFFKTVEVNSTFYRLPAEKSKVEHWYTATPDDFIFAVKASRFITHNKKLADIEIPLFNFLDTISPLREKLGPILFQLPPSLKRNDEKLTNFLSLLPKKFKYAVEFRNESWYTPEIFELMRKNNISLVLHDHRDGKIVDDILTADFVYIRFHGPNGFYGGSYSRQNLKNWAKRISKYNKNSLDVFVYFNNDNYAYAIKNAQELKELID